MDYKTILNKLSQINSFIESIKYIQELCVFLAPIIMGIGGKLYMDYNTIGILLFVFGAYALIWSFKSSFRNLEKNLRVELDKKINIPEEIEFEQELIPLKKVIDSFKEYNLRIHRGSTQKLWSEIFGSDKAIVNQELVNLLDYAIGEEITIYGQKTESIQNLQPLNLMNINTNPFYLKENWDNDYNSVYDNRILLYTNLKVRKCDLDKLIEKHKQPRIDIINS
jgi:hypothetical protein